MPAEISMPVFLPFATEAQIPVSEADIGDGVRIEMLDSTWLPSVRAQCEKVRARMIIQGDYTHRFVVPIDPTASSPLAITEDELQPLLRAISLSHIVKPTNVAMDDIKIKSIYEDNGNTNHFCMIGNANLSIAFTSPNDSHNTLTEDDCRHMAALWSSFSGLFADSNSLTPRYSRIIRAIKSFEFAHYIYFSNLSYLVYHAALESLIYFGDKENAKQITLRLPVILPGIVSDQDADEIYKLNNHLKHGPDPKGRFKPDPDGGNVIRLMTLLRRSIRELLLRALSNQGFADILVDHDLMKRNYGVQTGQGIM